MIKKYDEFIGESVFRSTVMHSTNKIKRDEEDYKFKCALGVDVQSRLDKNTFDKYLQETMDSIFVSYEGVDYDKDEELYFKINYSYGFVIPKLEDVADDEMVNIGETIKKSLQDVELILNDCDAFLYLNEYYTEDYYNDSVVNELIDNDAFTIEIDNVVVLVMTINYNNISNYNKYFELAKKINKIDYEKDK